MEIWLRSQAKKNGILPVRFQGNSVPQAESAVLRRLAIRVVAQVQSHRKGTGGLRRCEGRPSYVAREDDATLTIDVALCCLFAGSEARYANAG